MIGRALLAIAIVGATIPYAGAQFGGMPGMPGSSQPVSDQVQKPWPTICGSRNRSHDASTQPPMRAVPMTVSDSRAMTPFIEAQLEAAVSAGYEHIDDLNVDRPEGVSRFQLTQRNGMRCSAADAFLHPAASRPNLDVRSGVFVERIVFEGDRAVGVELVRDGVRETARAEREVIVSASATGQAAWVLSNHDFPRVATRVGPARAALAAMLLLTLPGAVAL